VFKRKANGIIERFKARLVARGFTQKYGLGYDETFSHVAKLTIVQVLLDIATSKRWTLWQMDVNNAFLYGDLNHSIYMEQPEGFQENSHLGYVCRLKKALYGLKQTPRAWYGKIAEFLEHNAFTSTSCDAGLFVKSQHNKTIVVVVYVDDLIITGDLAEEIELLKQNLKTQFKIKDLGRLKRFLGLEV
jgi:hypothetical protein